MAQPQARLLGMLDTTAAAFWSHLWRFVVPGFWLLTLLWVVLASSTCDFEQSLVGLVLLLVGGAAAWNGVRRFSSERT